MEGKRAFLLCALTIGSHAIALVAVGLAAVGLLVSSSFAISLLAVALVVAVALSAMLIAGQRRLLLSVRHNSTRQMTDQALLHSLHVVTSGVGAAPEFRVDSVDNLALGHLLRDHLAAKFDSLDQLACKLHLP